MHSIRVKIMAVTIAAILTSILALGGIGALTIGAESDRSSAENMRLICDNIQQELDGYLNSLKQSVDMAIHMADGSLADPDLASPDDSASPDEVSRLDAAVKAHCDQVERAFASIANNTSGIATYYYCVSCDYGSNEHGFFWSKKDSEAFVKQPWERISISRGMATFEPGSDASVEQVTRRADEAMYANKREQKAAV